MSDIHFTTSSSDVKMNDAHKVMDDMATRFLEPDTKNKSLSKMYPCSKESVVEHV